MKLRNYAVLGLFVLVGCSGEPVNRTTGVYMLLDTSGTYADEIGKAQHIISYTLAQLEPGDSFALARIDTGSFSEKDIVAKVSLDTRPSTSNAQKRQFLARVQEFVESVRPSPYTDITGGLLQALEYLDEKDPGTKTILIFSDLKEDLEEGYVRDIDARFDNVRVVALNVTKLRSDNIDPRQYLDRLDAWRQRVEQSGGTWRVINDLDNLEKLLRT